jgi:hypothetical protein
MFERTQVRDLYPALLQAKHRGKHHVKGQMPSQYGGSLLNLTVFDVIVVACSPKRAESESSGSSLCQELVIATYFHIKLELQT